MNVLVYLRNIGYFFQKRLYAVRWCTLTSVLDESKVGLALYTADIKKIRQDSYIAMVLSSGYYS